MTPAIETLQRKAWRSFAERGMPARGEEWKYTDPSRLTAILGERWWTPAEPEALEPKEIEALAVPELDADRVVFVDGAFRPELSRLPAGVELVLLSELEDAGVATELLDACTDRPLGSTLTAVNAALARDGFWLRVPRGHRAERPLYVLHVGASRGAAHLRLGYWLEPGAEAHVIEHFTGTGRQPGLTSVASLARLRDGARLTHERIQLEPDARLHLGRLEARLARDAGFVSRVVSLGAAWSRLDVVAEFAETGGECLLDGLYMAGRRQHMDHHTWIDHRKPHCRSRQHYRGVVHGRARAVFDGCIRVFRGASGTDAAQQNRNLLLSPRAEVDAKPQLIIDHDDVRAAHGCTVGSLDADQMFYLRARGVPEDAAREMLTRAFAEAVLAELAPGPLRAFVEREAFASLPGGGI